MAAAPRTTTAPTTTQQTTSISSINFERHYPRSSDDGLINFPLRTNTGRHLRRSYYESLIRKTTLEQKQQHNKQTDGLTDERAPDGETVEPHYPLKNTKKKQKRKKV